MQCVIQFTITVIINNAQSNPIRNNHKKLATTQISVTGFCWLLLYISMSRTSPLLSARTYHTSTGSSRGSWYICTGVFFFFVCFQSISFDFFYWKLKKKKTNKENRRGLTKRAICCRNCFWKVINSRALSSRRLRIFSNRCCSLSLISWSIFKNRNINLKTKELTYDIKMFEMMESFKNNNNNNSVSL